MNALGMRDIGVKERLVWNSARIANWTQTRENILEITRTQQYTDSKPVPMQVGVRPKRKGKGKDSKDTNDAKNESSKKVKVDDLRRCRHCQPREIWMQTGTERPCRCRAGKPVTANSRPSSTAAVAPSGRRPRDNVSPDSATC